MIGWLKRWRCCEHEPGINRDACARCGATGIALAEHPSLKCRPWVAGLRRWWGWRRKRPAPSELNTLLYGDDPPSGRIATMGLARYIGGYNPNPPPAGIPIRRGFKVVQPDPPLEDLYLEGDDLPGRGRTYNFTVAWRAWGLVEGHLGSTGLGKVCGPWLPDEAARVMCLTQVGDFGNRLNAHTRSAPHVSCDCGIYALREPEPGRLPETSLFGRVALWGKIIPGEHGYRAQYAYPLSLAWQDGRTCCGDRQTLSPAECAGCPNNLEHRLDELCQTYGVERESCKLERPEHPSSSALSWRGNNLAYLSPAMAARGDPPVLLAPGPLQQAIVAGYRPTFSQALSWAQVQQQAQPMIPAPGSIGATRAATILLGGALTIRNPAGVVDVSASS